MSPLLYHSLTIFSWTGRRVIDRWPSISHLVWWALHISLFSSSEFDYCHWTLLVINIYVIKWCHRNLVLWTLCDRLKVHVMTPSVTTSQPKPARKDYAEIKLTQHPFWISVDLSEHYTNLFVSFPMNVSIVFGHLRNARLFKWLLSDMAAVRKVSKTLEFKTFFTGFLHDVVVKQRWTNCRNIKVKQIIFLASWHMIYMKYEFCVSQFC